MAVIGGSGDAHELGAALRKLRVQRGLTMRDLGRRIGVSSGNFTHWETGNRLVREDHLINILKELSPDDDERERLLGLHRKAGGPGELVAGAPSIGAQLAQLIEYEQVARKITAVGPLVLPGLLQTSDYARATLRGNPDIETRVALRVGRRDVLTRNRQPVQLEAFIDSEVLARPIAPPNIMADQHRHLLRMAELSNVTIRLVSSTTPGYNPMIAGPFILLEFATATPVVHLEHYVASAFLWDKGDVRSFAAAVEEIRNVAMTPEETSRVIAEIVNGMETT